ncbi:hypothetical protein [Streptomyces sp. WMMC1477]|uniref:hypothetical protein n=1 Tax=Streptomyces sp. WMMC1477 TaxID=3015155 RepID=UPI0022B64C25|nr:hypothetical protein [Streptomyces sp. WMMC1477]MCZ7430454.1 hypothetical protein [Streptomyces sp. WMMC1477]
MTPPPRSLRLGRRGQSRSTDPALDDTALAAARDALSRGRWADARTLLTATREDWDRRGHRALVLAQATGSHTWAREWQLAEPESPDAALLLACATVRRAVRGKTSPDAAEEAATAAERLAPDDPTPWLARLLLAHHQGAEADFRDAFDELRVRHRDHHHAHHLMTTRLATTSATTPHPVYEFARTTAEHAPADSPLALLPVVAHAERFQALAASGEIPPDPAATGHWVSRRARAAVRGAFDWWLEWGTEENHARRLVDLNYLAYAKYHEGRMAEAAALFQRIGPHVTPAPWSFTGRDAHAAFAAAREHAFRMA